MSTPFPRYFAKFLTEEQARLVFEWRQQGNTYRMVSVLASRLGWEDAQGWPVASDQQLHGEQLVVDAEELLGEGAP